MYSTSSHSSTRDYTHTHIMHSQIHNIYCIHINTYYASLTIGSISSFFLDSDVKFSEPNDVANERTGGSPTSAELLTGRHNRPTAVAIF